MFSLSYSWSEILAYLLPNPVTVCHSHCWKYLGLFSGLYWNSELVFSQTRRLKSFWKPWQDTRFISQGRTGCVTLWACCELVQLDTECVIPHLYSICEWSWITSSPVEKSCLLAYTFCHKSKMLSLLAFALLLHYTANDLPVSTLILVNDKFNKIYPAYVFV